MFVKLHIHSKPGKGLVRAVRESPRLCLDYVKLPHLAAEPPRRAHQFIFTEIEKVKNVKIVTRIKCVCKRSIKTLPVRCR